MMPCCECCCHQQLQEISLESGNFSIVSAVVEDSPPIYYHKWPKLDFYSHEEALPSQFPRLCSQQPHQVIYVYPAPSYEVTFPDRIGQGYF